MSAGILDRTELADTAQALLNERARICPKGLLTKRQQHGARFLYLLNKAPDILKD